MRQPNQIIAGVAGAFLAVLLVSNGCSSGPTAKPHIISFSSTIPGNSVSVDVVGVSKQDIDMWRHMDVKDYFATQNNPRRITARNNGLLLDWNPSVPLQIPRDDPKIKKWISQGIQYIVILADLPHANAGAVRYNEIDLADPAYSGRKTVIVVQVTTDEVSIRSEQH